MKNPSKQRAIKTGIVRNTKMIEPDCLPIVHIEIVQSDTSNKTKQWIQNVVENYIREKITVIYKDEIIDSFPDPNVASVKVMGDHYSGTGILIQKADRRFYV